MAGSVILLTDDVQHSHQLFFFCDTDVEALSKNQGNKFAEMDKLKNKIACGKVPGTPSGQ